MRSTQASSSSTPDGSGRMTIPGTATGFGSPTGSRSRPATPARRARRRSRLSLVPAYQHCTAPNRTHGPPLAFGSCDPPQPASVISDGRHAGRERPARRLDRIAARGGDRRQPGPTDEADVRLTLLAHGRAPAADLADYTGERVAPSSWCAAPTRRASPSTPRPGTMVDRTLRPSTPHALPTAGPEGATCSPRPALTRSSRARSRRAGARSGNWARPACFDGGADGDTSTNDNTVFAVSGLFIP